VDRDRLLRVLTELPAVLLEEFELHDLMGRFGDDVAAILGVAGAGVMLEDDDGDLRFVAASDPLLRELEHLQIELGEGPCLFAYREGVEVLADDLGDEARFPVFAAKAIDAGMRSVFSFPLTHRDRCIGALNLYDPDPRELSDDAIEVGRTLARVATTYLMHARELTDSKVQALQLTHALDSRVVIEQAKGYIAARRGIPPEAAWELLRRQARSSQRRVHDVAADVVSGELDPGSLAAATD
jgi:GAF domain-containing protein